MKRLTTRGIATAEAIRDREPFVTSGALKAVVYTDRKPSRWDSGELSGSDLARFYDDLPFIDYVVFSYATPIAWHTVSGWHKVEQWFSRTTTKHKGNLYLAGTCDGKPLDQTTCPDRAAHM